MNGIDALYKVRSAEQELLELRMQIDRLEWSLLPSGISYDKDNVQSSPRNQMEEKMPEIIDLISMYERRMKALLALKIECEKIMEQMENPLHRVMIQKYFFDGKTYEKIAEELNYTDRWIAEQMKRAKAKFNKDFMLIHPTSVI